MIIERSNKRQSIETVYEHSGAVRVFARTAVDAGEGELLKVVYTPNGYGAVPFDSTVPVFFVGSPTMFVSENSWGWFWIAGPIANVTLTDEAEKAKTLSVVGGMIAYREEDFLTRNAFAFVTSINEQGIAHIHLVPREIQDDTE